MKQRQYTELQIEIMKVIDRLLPYLNETRSCKQETIKIREEYGIEPPYLTLREYINAYCCGAYHTFHFVLNGIKVSIDSMWGMLTDEYSVLYPLTAQYYVVKDDKKDNGGDVECYQCHHYLTLEPKED